eukprot:1160508-Pelagomonas_calceolata.AAC.7
MNTLLQSPIPHWKFAVPPVISQSPAWTLHLFSPPMGCAVCQGPNGTLQTTPVTYLDTAPLFSTHGMCFTCLDTVSPVSTHGMCCVHARDLTSSAADVDAQARWPAARAKRKFAVKRGDARMGAEGDKELTWRWGHGNKGKGKTAQAVEHFSHHREWGHLGLRTLKLFHHSHTVGECRQREKEFPATVMVMVEGACSLRECALHWLWWWKWHPEAVRYKKSEQDWLLCKGWSKAMIGKEKGHCEF